MSGHASAEITKEIVEHGGVFHRRTKHGNLFKFPNGEMFLVSTRFARQRDELNTRVKLNKIYERMDRQSITVPT